MGTDIHMYIEHKSKKTHKFVFDFGQWGERIYNLFGTMAGTRGEYEAIYEPRGIPDDISPEVKEEYEIMWEGDAHTPSWLTTAEFRECLDLVIKHSDYNASNEIPSWLKEYEWMYEFMKYNEEEGEPCRVVFWFDN